MKKIIILWLSLILVACSDFDQNLCLEVPQAAIDQINEGSNTDWVTVIQSSAFVWSDNMYYIAWELDGDWLEKTWDFATFRVASLSWDWSVVSADAVAEEFFDWWRPNNISMLSVDNAERCLSSSQN